MPGGRPRKPADPNFPKRGNTKDAKLKAKPEGVAVAEPPEEPMSDESIGLTPDPPEPHKPEPEKDTFYHDRCGADLEWGQQSCPNCGGILQWPT